MVMQRRPNVRRRADGTARIQRESYSTTQTDWWEIRKRVWDRDDGKCQDRRSGRACGAPGKDVHHILKLSAGGTTTMSNLITLCGACHDARHTHLQRGNHERPKPKNPWGRKPALKPYRP